MPTQRRNLESSQRASLERVLVAALLLCAMGCASERYLELRPTPTTPLSDALSLLSSEGPSASKRTKQLLRRLNVDERDATSEQRTEIEKLGELLQEDPTPEKAYSYAELAFIEGVRREKAGKEKEALDYYAQSVANSYLYLFDDQYEARRNAYDPEFRMACDVYNSSLGAALRILKKMGQFKPGGTASITTNNKTFSIEIECRGPWDAEEIESIDFVANFELNGLKNQYHTFGLGVPLILTRKKDVTRDPCEEFYPPGLSFPATAFLHVLTNAASASPDSMQHHCRLEILDPLSTTDVMVGERYVPLETDLSIPLAHFLDHPAMQAKEIATMGLLDPDAANQMQGLYLMERFDPQKIPVVMVHGLWSSPMTWMEMYNDLRAMPEIRERYQFWFYLYPTGQPFWISAAGFRSDLNNVLTKLDEKKQYSALQHVVLVGHSMGGLVSKMQTVYSDDGFWNLVSDKPFDDLQAPSDIKELVRQAVFFEPNPAVKRVITIGTPHRGSHFANETTRWISHYLIKLPTRMMTTSQALLVNNPNFFRSTELLSVNTSIDSLSPKSPVLTQLNAARPAPWVKYHNIYGVVPEDYSLLTRFMSEGDSVVSTWSAKLEHTPDPQVEVQADHVSVHRHPKSVLEVMKILNEHATDYEANHRRGVIRRITTRP